MGRAFLLVWLCIAGTAGAAPPDAGWTVAERWAWERITAGEIADFNAREGCGGTLDPRDADAEGWADPCRQLGPRFVAQVLTASPWREATPFQGVRIAGARMAAALDLAAARIDTELRLEGSRFEAPVTLDRVAAAGLLSFNRSAFAAGLCAESLHAKGGFELRDGVVAGSALVLISAHIDGPVHLSGSQFAAGIVAFAARMGRAFLLINARVGPPGGESRASLNLLAAQIGGQLNLDGSHFAQGIDADALKLKDNFFMRGGNVGDAALILTAGEVDGILDLDRSELPQGLSGEGLRVGKLAAIRKVVFGAPLNLTAARFGDDLQLAGSELGVVDLRGATIRGELRLADQWHGVPRWVTGREINLRNARIEALEDAHHGDAAWPATIRFQGLVYERLGGIAQEYGTGMLRRPPEWYADWLRRDPDFSRQPYQQLASVLRAAGDPNLADEVLVTAGLREMVTVWKDIPWGAGPFVVLSPEFRDWAGRYVAWITIGFGIGDGYQRVLWWVLGLTLVGSLVLRCAPAARAKGVWWRLCASLDHLLPIIELNPEFGKFFDDPDRQRLRPWQVGYFALHALMGYIIGVVIAAGLGGLTQPG